MNSEMRLAVLNELSNKINAAVEYTLDGDDDAPVVIHIEPSDYLKLAISNLVNNGAKLIDIGSVIEYAINILKDSETIERSTRDFIMDIFYHYSVRIDAVTFDLVLDELLKITEMLVMATDEQISVGGTSDINDVVYFIMDKTKYMFTFSVAIW